MSSKEELEALTPQNTYVCFNSFSAVFLVFIITLLIIYKQSYKSALL